jgi:hypothetical protein
MDPKNTYYCIKESHHAILDLGSSVNILSKELYDLLDVDKKLEKCEIDLLLADDSTKHALGAVAEAGVTSRGLAPLNILKSFVNF